jgi:hypothetical protein
MINEKQYLELCDACNKILSLPDSTIERIAIPWLHVIREHPIGHARYTNLFSLESWKKRKLWGFKKEIKRRILWSYQIMLSIKNRAKFWFGSEELPNNVDYLIVSHALTGNQYSQKEDFYFGKIPHELQKRGNLVVVASMCHFPSPLSLYQKAIIPDDIPKLFFSDSLSLLNEIQIHKRMRKESHILKKHSINEANILLKRIIHRASLEAKSKGAQDNLRLAKQVEKLVIKLNPKAIITTYEGHANERIIFAAARYANPNIKCISYQHTGIFRLSNAIFQSFDANYNPDIIFTSGSIGKSRLEKESNLKNIQITVLGSKRGLIEIRDATYSCINSNRTENACLVIPEGFISECLTLFNFALLCAKQRPDIIFIWRLHPDITFEKIMKSDRNLKILPKNIILSTDTFENDIQRCNWVLYRGTTAVFKAISEGLRPIYLKTENSIPIDPLYEMKNWKISVCEPNELLKWINNDIANKLKDQTFNLKMARQFCDKRFAKINIDEFENIFN